MRFACLTSSLGGRERVNNIKCTTRHVKLSEKPQYEALSYMWGPKNYRNIKINGMVFVVRQNLFGALHALRLEEDTRTLWIDAICINQDDISECNHQVVQMGMIYKNAVRCVAWLGYPEDDDDSLLNVAIAFFRGARKAARIYPRIFFSNSPSKWDIRDLKGLLHFCRMPYWGVSCGLTDTVIFTDADCAID
jgi:hypothetical protein